MTIGSHKRIDPPPSILCKQFLSTRLQRSLGEDELSSELILWLARQ